MASSCRRTGLWLPLMTSDCLPHQVREHGLELQGAILDSSGEVEFIGSHPMQAVLIGGGETPR